MSQQQPSGPRGPRPSAAPRRDQQLQGSPAQAEPLTPAEDRQWATLAHFGGILGFVPSLAIYLVFRHRGPFTAQEAKEALNFTLPPTVLAIVANLLALIPVVGGIFGIIAMLIWLFMTISGVAAGIHCNKGRPYRYPLNLRLIQ
ncbi:DUF4870 domain-containing protein [Citricoccus sp. SGAir0253]|uniref:DUF4870 domain-containing protein n=1 Tax=Citricoccus sp. SGAir0253 TaxID=2567881 RepID=UPI001AEFAD3D